MPEEASPSCSSTTTTRRRRARTRVGARRGVQARVPARAAAPRSSSSRSTHENLPEHHEHVLLAAADHPDIHLVARYVSADEKNAMLAACDCYVSLHRSEGFGLTPAEAMYLGKPVIATAYGGVAGLHDRPNSTSSATRCRRSARTRTPTRPRRVGRARPRPGGAAHAPRLREPATRPRTSGATRPATSAARTRLRPPAQAMKRRLAAIYEQQRDVGPVRPRPGRSRRAPRPLASAIVTGAPPPRARHAGARCAEGRREGRDAAHRAADRAQPPRRRPGPPDARPAHVEHHRRARRAARDARRADGRPRRLRAELKEARPGRARSSTPARLRPAPCRARDPAVHGTRACPVARAARRRRPRLGLRLRRCQRPCEGDWYRAFEDAFRGSEMRVRELQERYVDLVPGTSRSSTSAAVAASSSTCCASTASRRSASTSTRAWSRRPGPRATTWPRPS